MANGKGAVQPWRAKGSLLFWVLMFMPFLWSGEALSAGASGKTIGPNQAQVTFLRGKAEVLSKGQTAWTLLTMGSVLSSDD